MAPKQREETPLDDLSANIIHQNASGKVKQDIVWKNVMVFTYVHLAGIYGAYLMFTSAKLYTIFFACFLYYCGGLGITAGVHRLWSHRSYKAKWPLRLLLAVFNTIAFQNDILDWTRDHRVHHKYSDTDADPHNAKRGFFFSHIGWLLCRKHPLVIQKGKEIDLSDLESDSIVMFQRKYYRILMPLIAFIIPTIIPVYCWNETWSNSWHVASVFRYFFTLNMTWFVNSAAHMWGSKPYDKSILPCDNILVFCGTLGEGWHNYHHTFPWDYKSDELAQYSYIFNPSTAFIHFMVKIGLASDLKTISKDLIVSRAMKTGDGSHPEMNSNVWGWTDSDLSQEDREKTVVINGNE